MYTLPYDATSSTIFFSRFIDPTKDFVVSFDFACYGPNLSGSEGFCVHFTKSDRPFIQYGGPGPGLGYCPVSGVKAETDIAAFWGTAGGILGIGFDLTGNFGSNKFCGSGLNFTNQNTITLRGSGSEDFRSGYDFITQTKNINTGYYDKPISLYQQTRDSDEPIYKRVRIRVTDYGRRLIIDLKSPEDLFFTNYLDYDISGTVNWGAAVRCALSFSTGLYSDTVFKIKGFDVNGNFTTIIANTYKSYIYYLDAASLSGSTIDYVKTAFEINDVLKVINAGTTLPAITAAAPLVVVDPINGPDGAPYNTKDNYFVIDPNPYGRPDPRKK